MSSLPSHPAQQILHPVFLQMRLTARVTHRKQYLARAKFKSSAPDRPQSEVWQGDPEWAGPRGKDVPTTGYRKASSQALFPHTMRMQDQSYRQSRALAQPLPTVYTSPATPPRKSQAPAQPRTLGWPHWSPLKSSVSGHYPCKCQFPHLQSEMRKPYRKLLCPRHHRMPGTLALFYRDTQDL